MNGTDSWSPEEINNVGKLFICLLRKKHKLPRPEQEKGVTAAYPTDVRKIIRGHDRKSKPMHWTTLGKWTRSPLHQPALHGCNKTAEIMKLTRRKVYPGSRLQSVAHGEAALLVGECGVNQSCSYYGRAKKG